MGKVITRTNKTVIVKQELPDMEPFWDEARKIKYKKMKKKLAEYIIRHKETQSTVDRANRKIQTLEKKLRNYQINKGTRDPMDMDVAQGGSEKDDQMDEDGDDMDEEDDEEDEASVVYVPPKRVRASRKRRLSIPRDENGVVQLPFQIASLTILSLGKIDYERPLFHNERYIWPIGYTAEKTFMSMLNPVNQTVYTCRVEDGQDGPLFTLQAADAPDIELSAKTATGVWALVIKKANEARKKESSNAISGPEYYGFAHPLVCEMIEEMDGVDQCTRYVRRT